MALRYKPELSTTKGNINVKCAKVDPIASTAGSTQREQRLAANTCIPAITAFVVRSTQKNRAESSQPLIVGQKSARY